MTNFKKILKLSAFAIVGGLSLQSISFASAVDKTLKNTYNITPDTDSRALYQNQQQFNEYITHFHKLGVTIPQYVSAKQNMPHATTSELLAHLHPQKGAKSASAAHEEDLDLKRHIEAEFDKFHYGDYHYSKEQYYKLRFAMEKDPKHSKTPMDVAKVLLSKAFEDAYAHGKFDKIKVSKQNYLDYRFNHLEETTQQVEDYFMRVSPPASPKPQRPESPKAEANGHAESPKAERKDEAPKQKTEDEIKAERLKAKIDESIRLYYDSQQILQNEYNISHYADYKIKFEFFNKKRLEVWKNLCVQDNGFTSRAEVNAELPKVKEEVYRNILSQPITLEFQKDVRENEFPHKIEETSYLKYRYTHRDKNYATIKAMLKNFNEAQAKKFNNEY